MILRTNMKFQTMKKLKSKKIIVKDTIMNLKIVLNQFHEGKQRGTNKMILSQFHDQMMIIQMMKVSNQRVKREIILKKVLENKDQISGRLKSLANKKSLLMISKSDKTPKKALQCVTQKELMETINLKGSLH